MIVKPNPAIDVDIQSFFYGRIRALNNIKFKIISGSLTAIVGPNGGGKSTLLKLITGIVPIKTGTIKTSAPLAYLPQSKDVDCTFPLRVEDVVAMGLWTRLKGMRRIRSEDRQAIQTALQRVGLSGFEKRSIDALSGGQLQRLFFARVIIQDADIILLDEPFTGIDAATMGDLLDLIQEWHKLGKTILAVMHDMNSVRIHFTHTALIAKNLIAFGPTQDVLHTDNFAKAIQCMIS